MSCIRDSLLVLSHPGTREVCQNCFFDSPPGFDMKHKPERFFSRRGGVSKPFSSSLNAIAYEFGGKENFIYLARQSEHEQVQRVVQQWDTLTEWQKEHSTFEDLCQKAGSDPSRFVAEVVFVAHRYGLLHAQLLATVYSPQVMMASIRAALKPKAGAYRKFLLAYTGTMSHRPLRCEQKPILPRTTDRRKSTDVPDFLKVIKTVGRNLPRHPADPEST
jgi:hypothetical protein